MASIVIELTSSDAAYVEAVEDLIIEHWADLATRPAARWLTAVCTECRHMPGDPAYLDPIDYSLAAATARNTALGQNCGVARADGDSEHIVINGFVVIGCGGYWQVNPAAAGIGDAGHWEDWIDPCFHDGRTAAAA